jgi:hypothetical protein
VHELLSGNVIAFTLGAVDRAASAAIDVVKTAKNLFPMIAPLALM